MSVAFPTVCDVKWLSLEVYRQFQGGCCSRKDSECKFTHPPESCHVNNGHVIACFDALKINGRNNLIQQKMAIMLQQMHFVLPGSSLSSVVNPSTYLAPPISASFPVTHTVCHARLSWDWPDLHRNAISHIVIICSVPQVLAQTSNTSHQKVLLNSDKMEDCNDAKAALKRSLTPTAPPTAMLQQTPNANTDVLKNKTAALTGNVTETSYYRVKPPTRALYAACFHSNNIRRILA
ncbi:Muscleblind-like protein 2a [Labeo rohita]|uniref:Muscleblind-like protein 2a n=1 Tax=Labeo rohita TaxID=84645 RepID=A0ABQ8MBY4_LABRO|nr:Muscleblind-like protein 2a [Labeo rohita]